MRYDPNCEYSRQHLAILLASRLSDAGFERTHEHTAGLDKPEMAEHVYERSIDNTDLKVQVYTTIVDDDSFSMIVRGTGKDAIRINVRAPDITRPIITETRINRTGKCSDIVDRMIQRARDAYKLGRKAGSCFKCGSTHAMSKAGKWYCGNVCWKSDEEKRDDRNTWVAKNGRSHRSRGYRRRY